MTMTTIETLRFYATERGVDGLSKLAMLKAADELEAAQKEIANLKRDVVKVVADNLYLANFCKPVDLQPTIELLTLMAHATPPVCNCKWCKEIARLRAAQRKET